MYLSKEGMGMVYTQLARQATSKLYALWIRDGFNEADIELVRAELTDTINTYLTQRDMEYIGDVRVMISPCVIGWKALYPNVLKRWTVKLLRPFLHAVSHEPKWYHSILYNKQAASDDEYTAVLERPSVTFDLNFISTQEDYDYYVRFVYLI